MRRLLIVFLLTSTGLLAATVAAMVHVSSAPAATRLVEVRVEGFGPTRVDRCPTCHEVPAGAEYPVGHPEVPGYHPVERFGCACCHGGEPRAVDRQWSHHGGREPLLHLSAAGDGDERPERLESACARCHVDLEPEGPAYDHVLLPHVASGRELFLGRSCWGCHRVVDISFGERGPDLSDAGARLTGDEIQLAIADPSAAPSSTTMPNFALPAAELRDLTAFLLAQVDARRTAAVATTRIVDARRPGAPPRRAPVNEAMAQGGDLMLSLGCGGCHRLLSRNGRVGPDLRWEGDLRGPRYLHDMISRPAATVVGSRMPPIDMSESELAAISDFLARQRGLPPPSAEAAWREICARCHGLDGRGRTAVAPYLARRPRDLSWQPFFSGVETSRLAQSLRSGVPGSPMAPWAKAIPTLGGKRVVAFLAKELHKGVMPSPRRLEVPRPPEKITDEMEQAAEGLFARECSSCHGPTGRGDGSEASSLRARPRDLGNGAFIDALKARRIYTSIAYGPVGSDMPGHLWGASPDTVWALVQKVRHLAGDPLTGEYEDDNWPWKRRRGRRGGRSKRGGKVGRKRGKRSNRPSAKSGAPRLREPAPEKQQDTP